MQDIIPFLFLKIRKKTYKKHHKKEQILIIDMIQDRECEKYLKERNI